MKIRVESPKNQHPSITLDRFCPNVGGCMRPCGNWCPLFQDWFAELTHGLVRIPICGHVNIAAEPVDNETAEYFRGEGGDNEDSPGADYSNITNTVVEYKLMRSWNDPKYGGAIEQPPRTGAGKP